MTMSKLLTTLLATGLLCQVQAADLFTPVQKTGTSCALCAADYF